MLNENIFLKKIFYVDFQMSVRVLDVDPLRQIDLLYEYLSHLDIESIIDFCKSDKELNSLCKGHPHILNLIKRKRIEHKTDLFLLNSTPQTYMNRAILKGDAEIIVELIKRGMDPSANNNAAIRLASDTGRINIVNLLLRDPRVDPTAQNNIAVNRASDFEHRDIVRRLLQDIRVRHSLTGVELEKFLKQVGWIFPPPWRIPAYQFQRLKSVLVQPRQLVRISPQHQSLLAQRPLPPPPKTHPIQMGRLAPPGTKLPQTLI